MAGQAPLEGLVVFGEVEEISPVLDRKGDEWAKKITIRGKGVWRVTIAPNHPDGTPYPAYEQIGSVKEGMRVGLRVVASATYVAEREKAYMNLNGVEFLPAA